MHERIIVPSAPILVESTRSIGYSFETAIADIVDNSISKYAKEINIYYNSINEQYVAILDNGIGMDNDELIDAMKYGSKNSIDVRAVDDLGRFGLGLKMASLSQCRKLTVISKKNNFLYGACWNLDTIVKTNNWTLILYTAETELQNLPHVNILKTYDSGTLVVWENFDRLETDYKNISKIFDEKIDITRKHLSLVFHRFLEENKVTIFMNKDKLIPIDPFFRHHTATQQLEEEQIEINGNIITIKPYILPYVSKLSLKERELVNGNSKIKLNQGLYIYRSKRLIIWGTWLRLASQHELKRLTRIKVDIPNTMDYLWEIDIKKSRASLPDQIKKELKSIIERAVGKSEKVFKYRGREVSKHTYTSIWNVIQERNNQISYSINKNSELYKTLYNGLDDNNRQLLNLLIKSIEQFFPFIDVYNRVSQNYGCISIPTIENDELYLTLSSAIQNMSDDELKTFFIRIENEEIFQQHKDIIDRLKEDYWYDKNKRYS